jgi:ParB family chromosome partitioning protein
LIYVIIAGECRWRAHVQNKAKTIRAIVERIGEKEVRLRAIVENVQRNDMNAVDEANGYQALVDDGMTVADIAKMIGKQEKHIERRLALLQLEEQVQQLVLSGYLQPRTAAQIAQLSNRDQITIVKMIQAGKLSDNHWDVRTAVRKLAECRAEPQQVVMFAAARSKAADVRALKSLEAKIDSITDMLNAGFDQGECVAAARVDPNRMKLAADQLALCKQHIAKMEWALRQEIAAVDGIRAATTAPAA